MIRSRLHWNYDRVSVVFCLTCFDMSSKTLSKLGSSRLTFQRCNNVLYLAQQGTFISFDSIPLYKPTIYNIVLTTLFTHYWDCNLWNSGSSTSYTSKERDFLFFFQIWIFLTRLKHDFDLLPLFFNFLRLSSAHYYKNKWQIFGTFGKFINITTMQRHCPLFKIQRRNKT